MHLKRWLGQQAEIETTQNLVISVLRSVNFEEAIARALNYKLWRVY